MPINEKTVEDGKDCDIIKSLLNGSPFKIRPDVEKLPILEKGRPLANINNIKRDSGRICAKTFQTSWYSIHKWLCGSESYNKLFCWPCLLMRPETSSWCSAGHEDVTRFNSLAAKHAVSKSHLKAISEYDEMLIKFNLNPEFVDELKLKLKEEEGVSDKSEPDDLTNKDTNELEKEEAGKEGNKNYKIPSVNYAEYGMNVPESTNTSNNCKRNSKITFKTWLELNKNCFPVSKSHFLDDIKLYKWKRKIAQQELKNARLTEEKLKFEIEVLKAKAEYYTLLRQEVKKYESSVPIVNQ